MKKFFWICFVLISCSAFGERITYEPKNYDYQDEVKCLAQNVYFEARDQPTKGQIAVALVTLNRVNSRRFPNNICKVIHQASRYSSGKLKKNKCHFSWYCDGLSDKPKDEIAWKVSQLLATAMYEKRLKVKDFLHGATHYHRKDVDPYWNRKMLKYSTIGDHIFYIDPYRR